MADREMKLDEYVARLPDRHRLALEWYASRTGLEIPWPVPIELGEERTFLATQAKGIYKPEWSRYALSVRQTLTSPYPDREPIVRADGSWAYQYFQENDDPAERDNEFTNIALMECMRDRVPVAVMRQTKPKPGVRYHVLGLALVSTWDKGYFFFEGFDREGATHPLGPRTEIDVVSADIEDQDEIPPNGIDARKRVLAQVIRRRGQAKFRNALLDAYDRRCCITGCDLVDALEAAHISPYNGPETNRVTNGLLLRADIHTLFDLGLLAISESMSVILAPELRQTSYAELSGRCVSMPRETALRPSATLLAEHREFCRLDPE